MYKNLKTLINECVDSDLRDAAQKELDTLRAHDIAWINLKDEKPYDGQIVWYKFKGRIYPGQFEKDKDGHGDTFFGAYGFLTNDVCEWAPITVRDL